MAFIRCMVGFIKIVTSLLFSRFLDDIQFMVGRRPGKYWVIMWKFVAPALSLALLVGSVVKISQHGISYSTWDKDTVNKMKNYSDTSEKDSCCD